MRISNQPTDTGPNVFVIQDIPGTKLGTPKINIIGVRPGEKIHEQMISTEESPFTYEYKEYYKILPQVSDNYAKYKISKKNLVKKNFFYRSDTNNEWMEKTELKKWIKKNYL